MFRRPSCGLTAVVRLTIPRLSPRHSSQDFRFSANENVAMLSSLLPTNRRRSNRANSSPSPLPGGGSGDEHNSLPANGQGVDLVSQAQRQKEHLEDLQKACVLRWRGCEGTTKERRVLQASSGEDAGIRALLSRIGARRAEGGHRFARVYSCRSALPTRLHPPTLIFERLGCCVVV